MNQNITSCFIRSIHTQTRCSTQITRRRKIKNQHQGGCVEQSWRQQQRTAYTDALSSVERELEARDARHQRCSSRLPRAAFSRNRFQHEESLNSSDEAIRNIADFAKVSKAAEEDAALREDEDEETGVQHSAVRDQWESLLDIDYRTNLPLALAREEPDLVTRCMFAAKRANDIEFLQSVTASDFSRILNLLSPSSFLHEFIEIHQYMKNALVNNLGLTPIQHVAKEYESVIRAIMDLRRDSGAKLCLQDYETILGAAKALHLNGLAQRAWALMHMDGFEPNTKCYNGLIGAKLRMTTTTALMRQHDRITQHNLKWRQAEPFRMTLFNYQVGKYGIAYEGDRLFNDMRKRGIEPDEESICNLIEAYAMEGQVDSVAAVLKSIWDIDVNSIKEDKDNKASPRTLNQGHPLYPSKQLLFNTVRAYCINNDLPTAYKLLQYICEHYQISVDQDHWRLLLEWAHVLSVRRTKSEHAGQDRVQGKLDISTVQALWRTMISPPYNIEPSSEIMDFLIRSLKAQRQKVGELVEAMEQGRAMFTARVRRRERLWNELEEALNRDPSQVSPGRSIETLTRYWEMAALRCSRDEDFLRAWLHYYLSNSAVTARDDFDAERSTIEIPKLLGKWRRYAPRVVHYYTTTGHVELLFRNREESEKHKIREMERSAYRARVMGSAQRMIDASWYTNFDSASRVKAHDWSHNRTTDLDDAHKRVRGMRRPASSGSWEETEEDALSRLEESHKTDAMSRLEGSHKTSVY